MIGINEGFNLFEGEANPGMQFIKESRLKRVAKETEVKVLFVSPEETFANAALRNKAVDMRIPFEIASEGMENADKTGSK